MEIEFNSSLTADEETRLAEKLLATVGILFDRLPIAYTIRIRTSGGNRLRHTHVPGEEQTQVQTNDTEDVAAWSPHREGATT